MDDGGIIKTQETNCAAILTNCDRKMSPLRFYCYLDRLLMCASFQGIACNCSATLLICRFLFYFLLMLGM